MKTRVIDAMWKTGDTWPIGCRRKKRRQESVGSLGADRVYLYLGYNKARQGKHRGKDKALGA